MRQVAIILTCCPWTRLWLAVGGASGPPVTEHGRTGMISLGAAPPWMAAALQAEEGGLPALLPEHARRR